MVGVIGQRHRQLGMTQEDCAYELGVSRERIGQIERSALLKLRDNMILKEFLR